MIKSIGEAAEDLNRRYRSFLIEKGEFFVKGEKSRFFLAQMRDLFEKVGSRLGYNSFSLFKKDLQFCRKNIKAEKNSFSFTVCPPHDVDEYETEGIDLFPPSEGDTMLTPWQIEHYGLNPESY